MARLYVTYGMGYLQRNCYSVVEGTDELACMDEIQRVCGPDYAFSYREEEFAGQPERHGLRQIRLQPQVPDPDY